MQTRKVIALLVTAIFLTSLLSFYAFSPDLSYTTVIEEGSMTTETSYIFFKEDWDSDETNSAYLVRHGLTGEITYTGTNCSLLIQDIIDDADDAVHIHFMHGVYYLDTTIEVTKIIRISGEVQGYYWGYPEYPASHDVKGTTLVLTGNVTAGMFHWNHTEHIYNGWFEHIELNGGGDAQSATYAPSWNPNPVGINPLIWMQANISDVWFDHVFFSHSGTEAVRITAEYSHLWNFWFTDCFIESNEGSGFHFNTGESVYNLERIHIRGCHFFDNHNDIHIQDEGVNDVTIIENTSELTYSTFMIVTGGARDLIVKANEVYDGGVGQTGNYSNAFHINNTDTAIFEGNIIKNFENATGWEDGFNLANSNNCTISTNQIYDLVGSGVVLGSDANYNIVNDNQIHNNAEWGVDVRYANADKNLMDGNIILDNASGEIQDNGTGTVTGDNIVA